MSGITKRWQVRFDGSGYDFSGGNGIFRRTKTRKQSMVIPVTIKDKPNKRFQKRDADKLGIRT
jgi:hypothetical protein